MTIGGHPIVQARALVGGWSCQMTQGMLLQFVYLSAQSVFSIVRLSRRYFQEKKISHCGILSNLGLISLNYNTQR